MPTERGEYQARGARTGIQGAQGTTGVPDRSYPMRNDPEAKPMIDAVNDAISALSDLVRSLRAGAKQTGRYAKAKGRQAKGRASLAADEVKQAARAAKDDAKQVGRKLGSRLKDAWDIIAHGENGAAPRRRRRAAKK
jgi:hypothetical protein